MAILTPTKTLRTAQASASNAAAGTTTGSTIDLTGKFGGTLTVKMTNGSAPTVGCSCYVEVSGDGTDWKTFMAVTHVTTASAVGEWAIGIPDSVMYLRTRFSGNTGQAVTVEAFLQELTSIASA